MREGTDIALIAPCGINCGSCKAHLAGEDDEALVERLVAMGFDREGLPCPGCRAKQGDCAVIDGICETYACVSGRGFDFCYECDDFPCGKLNPSVDRAAYLPHNLKVFSLCFIERHGPAAWLEKEAEIKQRYFSGRMEIGRGPQLD